ncbi:hypothetical protein SAMN02745866_02179 [Alteromonadaceae bacterium Bs31]|nr:hypothetical protein SAMN02745866_02179 [Alteromonadaceae bacterium Bs31]
MSFRSACWRLSCVFFVLLFGATGSRVMAEDLALEAEPLKTAVVEDAPESEKPDTPADPDADEINNAENGDTKALQSETPASAPLEETIHVQQLDDSTLLLSEQEEEEGGRAPTPELKEAENIDLKEVVLEPLATPLPTSEVEPELVEDKVNEAAVDASELEVLTQEPLIMLDSAVPPGTSTRLAWTPNVSFMGISAPTPVLVVHGAKPGPKLCLTAAIHGDELNGIEVVRALLYSIDPEELSGTVIGVPIVNLQGFRRSSRYLPDRRDLNRFFPGNEHGSSASRIAHSFFEGVIRHCDILVDLHTGSFHRTNLPQLRANLLVPEVTAITEKMGSIVVVHSEGAAGCLRRAAVENGVAAVTLEAGQPNQLQKSAVTHGTKSIETLMDSLGMLDRRPFWEFKVEPVYYQSIWVRATAGGILFSEVALGAGVEQGEILGVVTDPITNMRHELISPYAGRVIGMALNQVMYPGFAAYHIGLRSSVEDVEEDDFMEGLPTEDGGGSDDELAPGDMPPNEHGEGVLEDSE